MENTITLQKKVSNNVCFEFGNYMIVTNSAENVKKWVNSLPGLTCSGHAESNIGRIINSEWESWGYYNQHKSPLNKDGYRLESLKTTGIGDGSIKFFITNCKSVEDVIAERKAYRLKVEELKIKVSEINNTLGKQLLVKLSKKSKSCVELYYNGGTQFVLKIGQKGYWFNDGGRGYYAFIEEYFTHFDGETLITDEGKNVIDILNNFIHEN